MACRERWKLTPAYKSSSLILMALYKSHIAPMLPARLRLIVLHTGTFCSEENVWPGASRQVDRHTFQRCCDNAKAPRHAQISKCSTSLSRHPLLGPSRHRWFLLRETHTHRPRLAYLHADRRELGSCRMAGLSTSISGEICIHGQRIPTPHAHLVHCNALASPTVVLGTVWLAGWACSRPVAECGWFTWGTAWAFRCAHRTVT